MPPSEAATALERIARAALAQVEMLLEGREQDPPADAPEQAQSSLDLLLRALASEAVRLEKDASLPEGSRKTFLALRERVDQLQRASIDARHHLIELGQGWRCPACKADVVAAARVDGAADKRTLQLVCQACGTRSLAAAAGEATFRKLFGALFNPSWNPAANGFQP